jgi:hypothetical protein
MVALLAQSGRTGCVDAPAGITENVTRKVTIGTTQIRFIFPFIM